MTFAKGQKIFFKGRNRADRAAQFAVEFNGSAKHNDGASVVTLNDDVEVTPKKLIDFGLVKPREAEPPRGKRQTA
jgi:hypothetical protein